MPRKVSAPKGLLPGELSGQPRVRAAAALTGYHRHGCTECGQRYDDACTSSGLNGRCRFCRGVAHRRAVWEESYAPRTCCRTMSRPATRDEVERYRLGGPGPWWICSPGHGCARTHPYDPRVTQPAA